MKTNAISSAEFWYFRRGEPTAIPFGVNPDDQWHEYVHAIPPNEDTPHQLRVDPALGRGHITIAWIKVEA